MRDVQNWMLMGKFKLNPDKTEFIIWTRQRLEKVKTSHLIVGKSRINSLPQVRNLESWFYSNLDMLSHVNSICSSSFYYIYNIRRIRKYLSHQTAISLVRAFITSKLDYCSSLLYGLPTIHINKLQRVQNAAVKLATNTPCIYHVTPVLKDLQWFAVEHKIEFKIVSLTFKCLWGLAPQYLVDLIAVAAQSRNNLSSRNATLLVPTNSRCLPTLADWALQLAAPKLWNSFPAEIRNIQSFRPFKRALKTYSFKIAF